MPGQASLRSVQYYGHPRNAFWPIMLGLINDQAPAGRTIDLCYQQRCDALTAAGFALWDVLASCDRPGSLDSAIVRQSEQPNDIAALLARHPELHRIAFNGKAAGQLFRRHIQLPAHRQRSVQLLSLPSSSPAMAALTLDAKYRQWCNALTLP